MGCCCKKGGDTPPPTDPGGPGTPGPGAPTTGGGQRGPTTGAGPGGPTTGGGPQTAPGGDTSIPGYTPPKGAQYIGKDTPPPNLGEPGPTTPGGGPRDATSAGGDTKTEVEDEGVAKELELLPGGHSTFSDWMVRRGDYVRVTADLVAKNAADLVVRLFTKAEGITGDGTEVDATTALTLGATERKVAEWGPRTGEGLHTLVRYKFTSSSLTPGSWLLFRMLRPIWFDAVAVVVE